MQDWSFLWHPAPQGLLLDENGDGYVDGIAASIVPIGMEAFGAGLWAACANFAARLGLESPSIHFPLTSKLSSLHQWQVPVLIALSPMEIALAHTAWQNAAREVLYEIDNGDVAWLHVDGRHGLWIHAQTSRQLESLVNEIAGIVDDPTQAFERRSGSTRALDLGRLFAADPQGFYVASSDGYTLGNTRGLIGLGPVTSPEDGAAAIDLAARIGMETAGLTLPLAYSLTSSPDSGEVWLLFGFQQNPSQQSELNALPNFWLGAETAHYLAYVSPYLSRSAQVEGSELSTLSALTTAIRTVINGHPPQVKAALATVQLGSTKSFPTEDGPRKIFSFAWEPPDGHDNITRIQSTFATQIFPELSSQAYSAYTRDVAPRSVLTVFCSAPLPARQKLQTEMELLATASDLQMDVLVMPSHKSGLAWVREQQVPILAKLAVASIDLAFTEFRPEAPDVRWLDLPTRWLQEWFPVKEVICTELALEPSQVHLTMKSPGKLAHQVADYRLTAHANDGSVLHDAVFSVLYAEREYLAGMPDQGLVHPSTAGFLLKSQNVHRHWAVPTDEELFWDFHQKRVLPALRCHVLDVTRGRPTPDGEPYFERLEIDGAFGWPDEPLPLYEEFISVGEALHEDLYFNTLDYLAAMGEQFCGRPIAAAGQVLPFMHDYMTMDGTPCAHMRPRALVNLFAWPYPAYFPEHGIVAGDRHDLPKAEVISISRLQVADGGDHVSVVVIQAQYENYLAAEFAARVLDRWRLDGGSLLGLPPHVRVEVQFCVGPALITSINLLGSTTSLISGAEPVATCSRIVGLEQLDDRLTELHGLPGVRVWQLGVTYQGRPGWAVDVTLPQAQGQTHTARSKLTLQKPTCVVIARHHANEVSSTTAALDLAEDLASDPAFRSLLSRINVVFLPIANPDGAALHYRLMAEHPHWKHHAARYNAAGKEFSSDQFDPDTQFGEALFRHTIWERWLPDAIVDNHGVPSHEWCQPFAGYNSPPRFRVSYHVVQAMVYGIIHYADTLEIPTHRTAAMSLRSCVAAAVAGTPWLHERNQRWLASYEAYGHRWLPEVSPMNVQGGMLFFYQGIDPAQQPATWRSFALRYPTITLIDWITEVADETAQGAYLEKCAQAHRIANLAMFRLVASSAQKIARQITHLPNGRITIAYTRARHVSENEP